MICKVLPYILGALKKGKKIKIEKEKVIEKNCGYCIAFKKESIFL
jgi:hypothetical protein